MDAKLTCPTLSVVLVRTIKTLCEINVKYNSKLEISGSLHIRSDGQKVLTCILDEETVRGQQDAARIAELAARLSVAAATLPFAHLQMTPQNNHSQQVAEALLSSIQGDMNLLNSSASGAGSSLMSQQQQLMIDSSSTALIGQQRLQQAGSLLDGQQGLANDLSALLKQQQDETLQAALRKSGNQVQQNSFTADQQTLQSPPSTPSRKQRQQQLLQAADISKMIAAAVQSRYGLPAGGDGKGSLASYTPPPSTAEANHIKLPDMQTLAHSLPKFPIGALDHSNGLQSALLAGRAALREESVDLTVNNDASLFVQSQHKDGSPSLVSKVDLSALDGMCNNGGSDPLDLGFGGFSGTPGAGQDGLDQVDVKNLTPREQILDGRRRFQCMFCGIYLSTKCYLKNHVNAMHTRSRVYPCELCERYFYSAGALRIHKLRNHWTGARRHSCDVCGEAFLLPIELRKHVVKKHGGVVMPTGNGIETSSSGSVAMPVVSSGEGRSLGGMLDNDVMNSLMYLGAAGYGRQGTGQRRGRRKRNQGYHNQQVKLEEEMNLIMPRLQAEGGFRDRGGGSSVGGYDGMTGAGLEEEGGSMSSGNEPVNLDRMDDEDDDHDLND